VQSGQPSDWTCCEARRAEKLSRLARIVTRAGFSLSFFRLVPVRFLLLPRPDRLDCLLSAWKQFQEPELRWKRAGGAELLPGTAGYPIV
jgi:hypothetical protein